MLLLRLLILAFPYARLLPALSFRWRNWQPPKGSPVSIKIPTPPPGYQFFRFEQGFYAKNEQSP